MYLDLRTKCILELKVLCGPDKFYGRSKFGQCDTEKNRDPLCGVHVPISTIKLTKRVWVMHLCKNWGMRKSYGHVCLSNEGGIGWVCDRKLGCVFRLFTPYKNSNKHETKRGERLLWLCTL